MRRDQVAKLQLIEPPLLRAFITGLGREQRETTDAGPPGSDRMPLLAHWVVTALSRALHRGRTATTHRLTPRQLRDYRAHVFTVITFVFMLRPDTAVNIRPRDVQYDSQGGVILVLYKEKCRVHQPLRSSRRDRGCLLGLLPVILRQWAAARPTIHDDGRRAPLRAASRPRTMRS